MRKFLLSCTMLAAFGANVAADPFVSGGEPGWGNRMSSKQRRIIGFDDVVTAQKHYVKPNAPTSGMPGYAFKLLTIWQNAKPGTSTVKSEPFGVYASMQQCDTARAAKIAELDAANQRQPHSLPGALVVPTTTSTSNWGYVGTGATSSGGGGSASNWSYANGAGNGQSQSGWGYSSYGPTLRGGGQASSTTTPTTLGPIENMSVTFCEPGTYAMPKVSPEIASNIQTVGAAVPVTETATLAVPPGFIQHWKARRPFSQVIPGTADVVEVLSASGQDLVFTTKLDNTRPTNILLVNDDGEVVANLRVIMPGSLNTEIQQGPEGYQVYRQDNPNYVAPKEKK
jgi:hypothetical protein